MATTDEHLPEDIIVQILYRLPVKPLVRFKCVSKRWSSIVSDPQFAKSHFKFASERKTLSYRLLLSKDSQLQSLDFQLPSFPDDSSVRKLTFPSKEPVRATLQILGSCNGMVFVAADLHSHDNSYIWNPTTGLLLKLPNPGFDSIGVRSSPGLPRCGFGYVSATDDYQVFVAGRFRNSTVAVEMYSSNANSWKRIESQPHFSSEQYFTDSKGTFSNEALHWLDPDTEHKPTIIAFDLVKETFREMPLPLLKQDDDTNAYHSEMGVVSGGRLCVASHDRGDVPYYEIIQLWVMMDYDVCESWTKLFKVVNFVHGKLYPPFVYRERSIVMFSYNVEEGIDELVRFDYKEEDKLDKASVCSGRYRFQGDMMDYEESLLWLHDYQGAEGRRRNEEEGLLCAFVCYLGIVVNVCKLKCVNQLKLGQ